VRITFYFIVILFGLVASLVGCKKNERINGNPVIPPTDTTIHVAMIKINDTAAILLPASTKQLSVTITPAIATNQKINWRSSSDAIATVNDSGIVTGILEGACYIIGTTEDNASATDSIKIYVLKNYDVYVAGTAEMLYNTGVAAYWKNGIFSVLDHGYSASAIAVSNGDVYIAGTTLNAGNFRAATYWKNGVPVIIFDGINDESYVTSIAISHDTTYVSGWDWRNVGPNNTFLYHAHYWKCAANSIEDVPLFDSNVLSAYANAITFSNGNVYVAGTQANDNINSVSKYWINDFNHGTALTGGSFAQSNGIAVQGNNVYVAGADGSGNYGYTSTAKLWKNNSSSALSLTDGSTSAMAYCVGVSGNTVYVAGYEFNSSGKRVAELWIINGSSVETLRITDGQADAIIRSMAIVGDDIFLAGWEMDNSTGNRNAKYWRVYNKLVLPIPLISVYPESSEANGIFVQ
jgi:hypothetical protein